MQLAEYGIQNETSHTRVHVLVKVRKVVAFPTSPVQLIMYNYREGDAYVEGKLSGKGRLVPIEVVPHLKYLRCDPQWFDIFGNDPGLDNTSVKGEKAVDIVKRIIKNFDFPYWCPSIKDEQDTEKQKKGQDLMIGDNIVQVKCDWNGGPRSLGGTGNLFIQTSELNLYGNY